MVRLSCTQVFSLLDQQEKLQKSKYAVYVEKSELFCSKVTSSLNHVMSNFYGNADCSPPSSLGP